VCTGIFMYVDKVEKKSGRLQWTGRLIIAGVFPAGKCTDSVFIFTRQRSIYTAVGNVYMAS